MFHSADILNAKNQKKYAKEKGMLFAKSFIMATPPRPLSHPLRR